MSNGIEAFLEYISIVKVLSPHTIEAYKNDLLQFEEFTKKDALSTSSDELLAFLATIENSRTLNRKLSSINAFYDFCLKSDFKKSKPNIKLAKVPKTLPKFLEYDEIKSRLDAIDLSTLMGLRDYAFILFLYATGARVSEAINVKKSDIEEDWLKILNAKGDKERMVPIASNAIDAFKEYLSERKNPDDYLWLNYQGKRMSRITAFKITQKYLGVSPHVLRHSFATAMILGGADLRVVQELLGHVSIVTTQIYTHLQKKDLRDTVVEYHPLSKNLGNGALVSSYTTVGLKSPPPDGAVL
jgi:integrase/recombinase XerD